MAIDYRDLRSLTARELTGALKRDGFFFVRQVGSHQRFRYADGRRVTVAPHAGGDTLSVKTLQVRFTPGLRLQSLISASSFGILLHPEAFRSYKIIYSGTMVPGELR